MSASRSASCSKPHGQRAVRAAGMVIPARSALWGSKGRSQKLRWRGIRSAFSPARVASMDKIIIDQNLRSRLNGLDSSIEFCDESGKTLGHFLPEDVYREVMSAWGKVLFPDEEVAEA